VAYNEGVASIGERGQKIKLFIERALEGWGIPFMIVLVATASFGLGRYSAFEDAQPVVGVSQAPVLSAPQGIYPGGEVEASMTGTVYYFPWCSAAEKIPPGSVRWFADEKTAQAAGYRAAKNCKGME